MNKRIDQLKRKAVAIEGGSEGNDNCKGGKW